MDEDSYFLPDVCGAIARQWPVNAMVRQQRLSGRGIFRGNHISLAKHLEGANGYIVGVADWDSDNKESAPVRREAPWSRFMRDVLLTLFSPHRYTFVLISSAAAL